MYLHFALPPMENSTRFDNMSWKDQEILATQWLTVGQLEKAGESKCLYSGNVPPCIIRHSLPQGSVC